MAKKRISRILLTRIESQYNALGVFEEELIRNWNDMGIVVDSIEYYSEDIIRRIAEQEYDLVFMMNGVVLCFESCREVICKTPVYSYYVDHPLHLDCRMKYSDMQHCILVDNDFKDYVDRHHRFAYETEVVMQAGVEGLHSKKLFTERKFPVVFCGSYGDYHAIAERIKENKRSFQIFQTFMIEEALKNPMLTMEEIYDRTLKHFNFPLDEEEYTEFLSACRDVELYLRGYYRTMVVKQLVDAGIPVEVYGDGWEKLECDRKELLHCHAPVDYREMLDVFADAKIVLNVMPWAKAGFHDRIACGMLNGALVVSDETTYMREEQLDGNRAVLYSLDSLKEVPEKVMYYLKHLDEAERIAQSGYEWAKENHTWRNRAEQLYQIFENTSFVC